MQRTQSADERMTMSAPSGAPASAASAPLAGDAGDLAPLAAAEVEERIVRRAEARRSRALAEAYARTLEATEGLPDKTRELELRSLAAEAGLALGCSCRSAMSRLERAHSIVERFPVVQSRWEAGAIDAARAELIDRWGAPIEDGARRAIYEAEALWHAEQRTPGELVPILRRLAEQARELGLEERAREALALRRVHVEPLGDGLAALTIVMREWQARAILDRATQIALDALAAEEEARARRGRASTSDAAAADPSASDVRGSASADDVRGPASSDDPLDSPALDDPALEGLLEDVAAAEPQAPARSPLPTPRRGLDQARSDVLAELLLQADPAAEVRRPDGGRARVDARISITVPALALLGTSREPAELAGVGPVPLSLGRRLAAEQPTLERILTDPVTALPIAIDRYRPSDAMRRALAVRDETCRFPGCVRPAERCDLDHTHDAAKGGATAPGNLAHLCRWHHTLKHWRGWTVRQREDGELVWTSPSGVEKIDRPGRREVIVEFGPPGEPPEPEPPSPDPDVEDPPPF
ncbi:hypothetical protein USB125703_01019 [Pseudoclavibacter triregionum]|nr:hypothetical protein USB125703_01019 [Pseudoclavibacter triregionum]